MAGTMDNPFKNDTPQFGVRALIVAAVLSLLVGFFGGTFFTNAPWQPKDAGSGSLKAPDGADLAPFFKAWNLLDENFVSATSTAKVTPQEKVWGAIGGLATSFGDPYTTFFPPKEKDIFDSQVQGNFSGVGMEIGIKNNTLAVVSPMKGTPASRAGVRSGDFILKIDGKDTSGMSTDDAVSLIRGKEGTTVTLELQRGQGKPFEVSIVRETITLPTVDTTLRPDGVYVIKVYTFNSLAPDMFRNALRSFANSGSNKLVIDLRGNPGGYLEAAVDMASWFLPVGKIIVTEDYGTKQSSDIQRSRGYDVFDGNIKLAVLIDEGSASASEIFAGALRDHSKATLIGEKSFGKGSVQQLFDITSDTSLKITIARWLTPNGLSISHEGITPDIVVSISDDDIKAARDPQVDRAAQFLVTGE